MQILSPDKDSGLRAFPFDRSRVTAHLAALYRVRPTSFRDQSMIMREAQLPLLELTLTI